MICNIEAVELFKNMGINVYVTAQAVGSVELIITEAFTPKGVYRWIAHQGENVFEGIKITFIPWRSYDKRALFTESEEVLAHLTAE